MKLPLTTPPQDAPPTVAAVFHRSAGMKLVFASVATAKTTFKCLLNLRRIHRNAPGGWSDAQNRCRASWRVTAGTMQSLPAAATERSKLQSALSHLTKTQ